MSSLGYRLAELRNSKGWSQGQLALKVGKTRGLVSYWETNSRTPNKEDLIKLANIFGVSVDYLIGASDSVDVEPISKITFMSRKIPVYGAIPAGTPFEAIEDIMEEVSVPDSLKRKKDLFGLKVVGDSMNQILPDGFIAVFEKVDYLEDGDVGAVYVNGYDATIKKYHRLNNSILLEPLSYNLEHEPIIIKDGDNPVVPVGKLVWACSPNDYKNKW